MTSRPDVAFRWLKQQILALGLAAAVATGTACARAAPPDAIAAESQLVRGKVQHLALRANPSQEYLLYVPHRSDPGAQIFVTVHGISRNVEEHASLFAPLAEARGVVLIAPYFAGDRSEGYQRLGDGQASQRADLVLNAIVDEVAASTGADGRRFFLFGFSGGAQFAHRYVLAHPERVMGAAIGAAGWYTFPDDRTPYPYGLGPSEERSGLRFDPERFLRVPVTVLVGGDDTKGGESLRRNPLVDRQQGTTRLERARRWVDAMNEAARSRGLPPPASFQAVAGIGHSFREFMLEGSLGDRVFAALFTTSSSTPTASTSP
jgi:poly(3-hydroxybutyrate) depolymerase